jgi:hypothetical protein
MRVSDYFQFFLSLRFTPIRYLSNSSTVLTILAYWQSLLLSVITGWFYQKYQFLLVSSCKITPFCGHQHYYWESNSSPARSGVSLLCHVAHMSVVMIDIYWLIFNKNTILFKLFMSKFIYTGKCFNSTKNVFKKPRNLWKRLNFSEKSLKNNWNLYKCLTRSLHFSGNVFKKLRYLYKILILI